MEETQRDSLAIDEEQIRKAIMENGGKGLAIRNIPIEAYHSGPGLSSTDIKNLINGTIESWLFKKISPKDTHALFLGNAIHCMTLEPQEFWNRYCIDSEAPCPPSRATKEGKNEWREWVAHSGWLDEMTPLQWAKAWRKWRHPEFKKEPISREDIEVAVGIAESVKKHPMVSQMFLQGESEVTLYWIDKETGILCKCRPDRINYTFPCIPDLKSTTNASLEAFEGDITSYDYHVSAYWYLWGAQEVFGKDFENFVYIPCEKTPPYQVTFYIADEGSLAVGKGLCRAGIAIYQKYTFQLSKITDEEKRWSGYSLEPKSVGIRPWAFNKLSQVIHAHDLQGMGLEKYIG